MLHKYHFIALICACFVYLFANTTAHAVTQKTKPTNIDITDHHHELLQSIENWLQELGNMRAQFIQVNHDGSYHHGQFLVKRPGRMRLEYDPPSSILLIATGNFFIFVDKEKHQVTHYPLSATPIWFLLREDISFDNDEYVIDKITKEHPVITIRFYKRNEKAAGWLEMTFSESPLELRQWRVKDAQGYISQVTLLNSEYAMPLNEDLFHFHNPWIEKRDE